jgi:predicted dehydrogenase
VLIVNWAGGAVSFIESGWWQPHTDGPEAATQLYGVNGFGQLYPTYIQEKTGRDDPGFIFPRKDHAPQSLYDHQLAYLIDCIRKHQVPIPGGFEGWINMKVVDAAYKSAQIGQVVTVE